ncbi:MAG TPA: DUF4256 domain-containing protein [Anaerolineaceae bacterium]|nr:DUF4256 domain-containing protein [Anaerolineaceae bacterium]
MNTPNKNFNALTPDQAEALISVLHTRFEKHMNLHKGLEWQQVQVRLNAHPDALWALSEMERTGGEPDVVGMDEKTGEVIFFDCSPESPAERRSTCYDQEALDTRKANKPETSAMQMAAEMGITLLDEEEYQTLQNLGEFDLKTSSWLLTPPAVRKLGGAIFGDRRYDRVFIYHNGADSYYGARGFRGSLRV